MSLNKNEKELVVSLLKEHLKEIEETKRIPNPAFSLLAAEIRYSDFVQEIIKKLG